MTEPRKPGRPSKLTPELQAELLRHIAEGYPIRTACGAVGIHKSIYYDWLDGAAKARALQEAGQPVTPTQQRQIDFADALDLADAQGEAAVFRKFLDECDRPRGQGNWLPRYKLLGLRWPERWAERMTSAGVTQHAEAEPDPYQLDLQRLSKDEILALRKLVAKAKREDSNDGRKLRAV